ncbi:MAG: efflux RND transporter periplasmic adaptor subunit [Acidobacteriota bacterium]|nr:efflux RND transporter periplasmic adaptor subunit [Blastocatellia bacterium]MDW8412695.1 efflux RND transporter periplasmic adaptor subunit [Acidobacteriota bacterium]
MRIAIVLVFVMAIACTTKQQSVTETRSHNLQTEVVASLEIPTSVEVAATVAAKTVSEVAARTMGELLSVHVREGDKVNAGQILAELDARDLTAMVKRAEAGLEQAKQAALEAERGYEDAEAQQRATRAAFKLAEATYQRYRQLAERRSVSKQEFDEVEAKYNAVAAELERAEAGSAAARSRIERTRAALEQAKAEMQLALVQKSYSKVVAPQDGFITFKALDVGSLVTPGTILFRISSARLTVEAALEESRFQAIKLRDKVKVYVDALDKVYEAVVTEIVPAADARTRTFLVKADLPADPLLKPGMYARLRLDHYGKHSVIAVPRSAIVLRGQLAMVAVVRSDGTVTFRLVKLGRKLENEKFEVLSGLNEGDRIVVQPPQILREGDKVSR